MITPTRFNTLSGPPVLHQLNRHRRLGLNEVATTNADWIVNAWQGRIGWSQGGNFTINQSVMSANTLRATTDLVNGLINDGLWQYVVLMNTYPPDSLTALSFPIVYTFPGIQWGSFGGWNAATDLSVNGLVGNGAGKFWDTGMNAQAVITNINDWSVVHYNSANTSTGMTFGAYLSAGQGFLCAADHSDGKYYSAMDNVVNNSISGATVGPGYYCHSRVSLVDHRLYRGTSGGHAQLGPTDVVSTAGQFLPTLSVYAHCLHNDGGGAQLFTADTISFIAVLTHGMSQNESLAFFNRVQAYRQAIGGGFV